MSNRVTKEVGNFSMIPNELLNSATVSLGAKGLYAFMYGKPANWNFTIRSMAKQLKEGETAVGTALVELKNTGWVSYTKHQDGTGVYHLAWTQLAEQTPKPENPNLGEPNQGFTKKGKPQRINKKEPLVRKIDNKTDNSSVGAEQVLIDQESTEAKATAAQKSVAVIKPMVIEAGGKQFEIPGDLKYPGAGTKSHRTWINYAIRYNNRYGTWPLWNRMTAGVVTSFIGRVGEEIAPRVAAFYLTVNDAYVVKQMHPFKLLLSGAETYHTQYVTNTSMTGTRARQIDQTQSNYDAVDEAMRLLKSQEVNHENA